MNQKKIFSTSWVVLVCALITTFLWGSATPAIKGGYELFRIATDDIPTKMTFAGYRFTMAGILVLIFATIIQKKFPMLKKKDILPIGGLGLIQTTLAYIFFYIGLSYTTGAKGTLFSSVSALLVVLVSPLIVKSEHYTVKKVLGGLLGFAGLYMITMVGAENTGGFVLLGEGFVLMNSVCGAVCNFLIKKVSVGRDTMMITGWQLFIGGLVLLAIGLVTGGSLSFANPLADLLLLYMAALSSVAYTLWGMLLKYNDISKVSMFHLLTPVFGMMLSGIFLKENIITFPNISALVLVCAGIAIVNYQKETAKKN